MDEYKEVARIYVQFGFAVEQLMLLEGIKTEQSKIIGVQRAKIEVLTGGLQDLIAEWKVNEHNWEIKLKTARVGSKRAKIWKSLAIIGGVAAVGLGGVVWITH